MIAKPVEILLVEDNPADARLARESLKETSIVHNLHHVKDGEEALQFLEKTPPYGTAPTPDLIFLDLNLPRKDGRQILAEIKKRSALRRIPVIVLTTSDAEQDILQSYDLHANCYLTKPVELDKFSEIMSAIEAFWLNFVKLPGFAKGETVARRRAGT
jgi:CheY-like chemotaxis protein